MNIKSDDIEETPNFGASLNTNYILGMAKMEGGVKILLDIDRVLSSDKVSSLDQTITIERNNFNINLKSRNSIWLRG